MMTKEQVLELWKNSVLTLKNREKELDARLTTYNPQFYNAWENQWKRIIEEQRKLSVEDSKWFMDETAKWIKEVIEKSMIENLTK